MKEINSIESPAELDMVLAVMGDIDAHVACANADLDQALTATRRSFDHRFKVKLESGEVVEYSELRGKLEGLAQDYSETNRRELLAISGKKSVDLVHGVIGWRKGRDAINELEQTDDEKGKGVLAGLLKKLVALVATVATKLGKLPVSNLVAVSVKWDKSKLLDAVNEEKITEAQLAKQGLSVTRGIDQFYCTPKSEKRPSQGALPT